MNKKIRTYNIIFYSIIAASFIFILLSNPFLIQLYDPWRYHLQCIASFYNGGSEGTLWHQMWANVFKIIGINNIFTWAKIIHVFQFSLAAVIVFYFSKTVLTILIKSPLTTPLPTEPTPAPLPKGDSEGFPTSPVRKDISNGASGNDSNQIDELSTIQIKFLSLLAVFLWFIGNGTFSVEYQQAWIMWYSVTYQGLSIPLLWYSTALTLKIFYEDLTSKEIIFYIAQIAVASLLLARIHPSELIYYLIHIPIIFLISIKWLIKSKNTKILFFYAPIMFLLMFIVLKYFTSYKGRTYKVPLFEIISSGENIGQILQKINGLGHVIVSGWNRFPNSFSEIAIISLIAMIIFRVNYLFTKDKDISFNRNVFDVLLVLSLLFFLIPMVPFLAGLAGYLTNAGVVWRFFFASPWFIFLPFLIYRILTMKEIHIPLYKLIIILILILFSIASFHKYFSLKYTITNTKSIITSLDKEKVGVRYQKL